MTAGRSGALAAAVFLVGSALGVSRLQPRLAATIHDVQDKDDLSTLPPPAQLKAFALGYDSAMVDVLWANLLVTFGERWHEKREFHPDSYIEAMLHLEPTYSPLYRFADTLLCYHPLHATEADARKTRDVLERGTRERPWDPEVWQEYGQFIAFLAPSYLTSADAKEKDAWRRDGALAMAKAVDLGGDPSGSLIASTMLARSGERDASIASLQRSYAYTDDPEERAEIAAKLSRMQATAASDAIESDMREIEFGWRAQWAFLTRDEYLLLAPMVDPARCAGPAGADDPVCARDWGDFLAAQKLDPDHALPSPNAPPNAPPAAP